MDISLLTAVSAVKVLVILPLLARKRAGASHVGGAERRGTLPQSAQGTLAAFYVRKKQLVRNHLIMFQIQVGARHAMRL